eukprot:1143650-Pelagomonas_calceolata.AAC.1
MKVPILRRDLCRMKVAGRPGIERTKTASGRLWFQVEEPVLLGENHAGIAREVFPGTSIPCSRILSFQQASIPIRDEPNLPLLRALTQKLRPT